ncbi:MAG TPA: endolytic transglycosylase MltG [Solirubrobacteraceae bacterium]|nr:endolytic transglycosylase MltG [Solirubrobacteraceae bacterium]
MALFGRGGDERPRTAADREAARLERERRRAEREGRPLSEPPEPRTERDAGAVPFDHGEAAPFEWEPPPPRRAGVEAEPGRERTPEPEPARERVHPVEPAAAAEAEPEPRAPASPAQREPAGDEHPPSPRARAWQQRPAPAAPDAELAWEEPARNGERATDRERAVASSDEDPQGTQPFDPVTAAAAPRPTVSLPRPQTDTGEHADGWDAPIGTVRRTRAGGHYQAQPGAPGYPPYRKLAVNRPRRWLRRIVVLLVLGLAIGAAVFAYLLYQPMHGDGEGRVSVNVPAGSTAAQIGDLLEQRGVVSSGFFFTLRARLSGQREQLRSGRHVLRRDMPYGAALTALTTAPKGAPVLNVTLPEGPSRREAAPRVRDAGVRGDYLAATRRSPKLDPRDYGAPRGTRTLEGFLFPATYELRERQATASRLVSRQLDAFKDAFAKVDLRRARRRNLSRYDVLIIASMVEREALVARDRRLISAVIYNRLREDMPLGIDATLRYALNQWSRPLRVSELESDSAFNTRRRRGLPPTPIGNPGLAAMRAAANPANVPYLFYVVRPCGNGAHAFSATDAQFQRDVNRYNQARERRGGRDPSRC